MWPSSCVIPAGTSNELHVHNEWEENTHRHGAMAFVECLGFSQEDTMEGPLWRETLGRSLGSYDATELVGDVSWQWLPAGNHPPLRHILLKDGMELSHPQSGVPTGIGPVPS